MKSRKIKCEQALLDFAEEMKIQKGLGAENKEKLDEYMERKKVAALKQLSDEDKKNFVDAINLLLWHFTSEDMTHSVIGLKMFLKRLNIYDYCAICASLDDYQPRVVLCKK